MRITILLTMFLSLFAFSAQAITIDFTADTTGFKANGFSPAGNSDISFTDTLGSDLSIFDFGIQSDGQGLRVQGDDASQLQMDFSGPVTNLRVEFGNDDPGFSSPGDTAVLQGFSGGSLVALAIVILNRDDILNQFVSLAGQQVDQAFFFYANALLQPIDLIEIVDNISFDLVNPPSAVPLPAALPLFGTGLAVMGFIGWRRKRQTT